MKIKNYLIISLPNHNSSADRRANLKQQLKNKHYFFIDAIHGISLMNPKYRARIAEELKIPYIKLGPDWVSKRSNFKTMTNSLVSILPRFGLYLSTIKSLKYAIKNNYDHVLIMEDDAMLKTTGDIDIELDKNEHEPDLVYLGGTCNKSCYNEFLSLPHQTESKLYSIKPHKLKLYGTFGYVIFGQKKIAEILRILLSVFNDGKSRDKHPDWRSGDIKLRCQAIDLFFINHFQKRGNCKIVYPTLVEHPLCNLSTIDLFPKKKHKLKSYNLKIL